MLRCVKQGPKTRTNTLQEPSLQCIASREGSLSFTALQLKFRGCAAVAARWLRVCAVPTARDGGAAARARRPAGACGAQHRAGGLARGQGALLWGGR